MQKYRISKYDYNNRDEEGRYLIDEWTSYSDIGKTYNGIVFGKKEYLEMEQRYCEVVLSIMRYADVDKVIVQNIELKSKIKKTQEQLNQKELKLSVSDKIFLATIQNGKTIKIERLEKCIKLILRECFWCELKGKKTPFLLEFGYDYYAYVSCDSIGEEQIEAFQKIGIFVEPMKA